MRCEIYFCTVKDVVVFEHNLILDIYFEFVLTLVGNRIYLAHHDIIIRKP